MAVGDSNQLTHREKGPATLVDVEDGGTSIRHGKAAVQHLERESENNDAVKDESDFRLREVQSDGAATGSMEMKEEQTIIERSPALTRFIPAVPAFLFNTILQNSWEGAILVFQASLLNGGPSALSLGSLLAFAGTLCTTLSLAELASIDPVVGAQYIWTFRYTPPGLSPLFCSFMQGYITVIGWISGVAQAPYFIATLLQGIIVFNYPSFEVKPWQTTVLALASMVFPLIANCFAVRVLKPIQWIAGFTHIGAWVFLAVALWSGARRSTSTYVWTETYSGAAYGGWPNLGVSWCVGLLPPIYVMGLLDGVLHMSDEINHPRKDVPRAMLAGLTCNAITVWLIFIFILYCIGDPEEALVPHYVYPIIGIVYNATNSKAAVTALMSIITWNIMGALFDCFASVSRLVWAFARNRGLPFHLFFGSVSPTLGIPLNALGLVSFIMALLMILPCFSTTAYFALTASTTIGLNISYLIMISFFFSAKLRGDVNKFGPFKMGKGVGYAVNVLAMMYCSFAIVWLAFPPYLPVTGTNMNYAGPIVGLIILIALIDWTISGRKRFKEPRRVYQERAEEGIREP